MMEIRFYLAEGIATALTIWEALDKCFPVISVGSIYNLTNVIKALEAKYPQLTIIPCLDTGDAPIKQLKNLKAETNIVIVCRPLRG